MVNIYRMLLYTWYEEVWLNALAGLARPTVSCLCRSLGLAEWVSSNSFAKDGMLKSLRQAVRRTMGNRSELLIRVSVAY